MSEFYGNRFTLFLTVVGLPEAPNLETMKKEVESLSPDDIGHIRSVLCLTSGLLETTPDHGSPEGSDFSSYLMFPVKSATSGKVELRSASESLSTPWFIADQGRQHNAFKGQVDLSVFMLPQIRRMGALMTKLDLESRLISRFLHSSSTEPEKETAKHCPKYSSELRKKAGHIAK